MRSPARGARPTVDVAEERDVLERRALAAHLVDHRRVVARLERRRRDQQPDAGLVQHVLSSWLRYAGLMFTRIAPILAVAYWTSTHSAQFGDQMPTRSPAWRPRGRASRRRAGRPRHRARVGPAPAGRHVDQRLVIREPRHRGREVVADGPAEERLCRRSVLCSGWYCVRCGFLPGGRSLPAGGSPRRPLPPVRKGWAFCLARGRFGL